MQYENTEANDTPRKTPATTSLKDLKTQRTKVTTKVNNPAFAMVEVMKQNANLRQKKFEQKNANLSMTSSPDLDETDMFFLSMSRMTKKLPPIDQTTIKLNLSNSVLQAEIRNYEKQENIYYSQPSSLHSGSSRISYTHTPLVSPNETVTTATYHQSHSNLTECSQPMGYNATEDISPTVTNQFSTMINYKYNEGQERQTSGTTYNSQPRPTLLQLTSINTEF